MVSTIRTDPNTRKGRAARLGAASAGLVGGVALLLLAGPVASGGLAALSGNQAASELRQHRPLSPDQRLSLIVSRSEALGYFGASTWRRELATASLLPAEGRQPGADALARARHLTVQVLRKAPASSGDWLRLAQLDALAGDRGLAATRLETALLTGADMPRLRRSVGDLGLALWSHLSWDMRRSVLTAIRHDWQAGGDRKRILARAQAEGLLPIVVLSLQGEPELGDILGKMRATSTGEEPRRNTDG
jgi:hypothetical protein